MDSRKVVETLFESWDTWAEATQEARRKRRAKEWREREVAEMERRAARPQHNLPDMRIEDLT